MASSEGDAPTVLSRRDRYREQTRQEIKALALRQVERDGAGSLSLKTLAKTMGMAAPSLYRYFGSRDDLLTALLVDAYTDLRVTLGREVGPAGGRTRDQGDQLRRFARAYRRWALARPAMYELLFGTPVPGYRAPPAVTVPIARQSLDLLADLVAELRGQGSEDVRRLAGRIWARVHGIVSLELRGHLAPIAGDDLGGLYESEIDDLVDLLRRP